jgi:hypothetical protein
MPNELQDDRREKKDCRHQEDAIRFQGSHVPEASVAQHWSQTASGAVVIADVSSNSITVGVLSTVRVREGSQADSGQER